MTADSSQLRTLHVQVDLPASSSSQLDTIFAEELGLVVEVHPDNLQAVQDAYRSSPCLVLALCLSVRPT